MIKHSLNIKTSSGDEYYSTPKTVEMIIPHIINKGYKKIWCPFDTEHSNFVKILRTHGFDVVYGHIWTGQDFFDYDTSLDCDIIVSNPPFSKRNEILKKLFEWRIAFALVLNSNGLFDSKGRFDLFKENKNNFEILIPKGRMKFFKEDGKVLTFPNFSSIYLCSKLLDEKIVFSNYEF